MDRLRRTSDPGYAKYVEAFQGRRAVQSSGEAFSSAMRAISDAVAAREAGGLVVSGQAGVDEIPYIPGALTSAKTPADAGIGIKTKRSESDARFARRPMAVPLNEDSVEIARALGDDVSGYVDMGTGESSPYCRHFLQGQHQHLKHQSAAELSGHHRCFMGSCKPKRR